MNSIVVWRPSPLGHSNDLLGSLAVEVEGATRASHRAAARPLAPDGCWVDCTTCTATHRAWLTRSSLVFCFNSLRTPPEQSPMPWSGSRSRTRALNLGSFGMAMQFSEWSVTLSDYTEATMSEWWMTLSDYTEMTMSEWWVTLSDYTETTMYRLCLASCKSAKCPQPRIKAARSELVPKAAK